MEHGALGYYQTAAQIIPVIVLATVVEYRLFGGGRLRGDWWASGRALEPSERVPAWASLFVVAYGLIFLLAEAAALDAAHDGKASGWDDFIVPLALNLGFFMILFVPVQPYVEDLLDRIGPLRRAKLRVWRRFSAGPPESSDGGGDSPPADR